MPDRDPDPVALRLSRNTYRQYEEIRQALEVLAADEWEPAQAARFVSGVAHSNLDVHEAALAVVQMKAKGKL